MKNKITELCAKYNMNEEDIEVLNNWALENKKEVFDEIDIIIQEHDPEAFNVWQIRRTTLENKIKDIKKRHLSPSNERAGNYHKS